VLATLRLRDDNRATACRDDHSQQAEQKIAASARVVGTEGDPASQESRILIHAGPAKVWQTDEIIPGNYI
jgi:hypothetical protein